MTDWQLMNKNPIIRWVCREYRHAFHALHPESRRKSASWHNTEGPEFLLQIGVNPGDTVLDFGCGPGCFCLPAARVVGDHGWVYAVDKNPRVLRQVRRQAAAFNLPNLRTAASLSAAAAQLNGQTCNFIMIYDMLHFLDAPDRRVLYAGARGLLAEKGRLSVHLKHVKGDEPGRFFAEMTADEVAREIEMAGFCLFQKIPARIWHSYAAVESMVWNFIKRE